jgi:hypothetical protein
MRVLIRLSLRYVVIRFISVDALGNKDVLEMWLAHEPGAGSRDKESGEQGLS